MPGKDGFDALKMIKEDPEIHHLPVVILSSTSSEEDVVKSYNLGANSFISKKIDFDKFIEDMTVFKKYWLEVAKKP
jgi:CheY-like chemotaxis protein